MCTRNLRELFGALRRSGCKVLRLGGLGDALRFYDKEEVRLTQQVAEPIDVLRATLAAMREGAGPDIVFAGGWGTPLELVGLLDASTPSLPAAETEPLRREAFAAARSYYLHRGGWWAECLPVLTWADTPSDVSLFPM